MSQLEKSPEALLREHGLFKQPVDVEALAGKLNIAVKYEPLQDSFSAFLLIKEGKATAFVNSDHHPNRRRFSLAHEIGHFRLHHKVDAQNDIFLDKSLHFYTRKDAGTSSDVNFKMEREANTFAAALLMPEELLTKYIAKHGLDISDEFDVSRMAVVFGVSEQALQIRLSVLKLAEHNF